MTTQKHNTAEEEKVFLYELISTMINKNCYVKAYGKLFRVVDAKHNPEINIKPKQFKWLLANEIISPAQDIWLTSIKKNPFNSYNNIRLTLKQKQNEAI